MQSQTSFVTSPPKKSRGNRNKSQVKEQQNNQDVNLSFDTKLVSHDDDKVDGVTVKSDTSFINQDSDSQDQIDRKFKEDAISQKQEDDEELKPDKETQQSKLNESKWDDAGDAKQQIKTIPKRVMRGNRENRESESQKQVNKSQKESSNTSNRNINPDHQLSQQSTAPKRRGNRFPENESTTNDNSNFRKQNYDRNNQDINYERGFNNNYRNRGCNRQGKDSNYRGGWRGGYNNNYERRNYNYGQDDQNSQNGQNNDKKFQTDKELNESTYKNPNFQKKSRYEERNQYNNNNYGGYNRDYGQRRFEPQVIEKIIEKQVIKEKQVIIEKLIEPTRPMGIRVHPTVSIFVKGCKIQLTCRRLQKFKADLLVIPYKTYKLQLYPGNFVSSLKVNYKEKLKQRGPKLQEYKKLVYMQKCFGSQNFTALAFMKVTDPENDIKNGIKELLETIKFIDTSNKKKENQEQKFQSICFPICSQLEAFKTVIATFIQQIEKYSAIVKDVYISTEDTKAFCDAMTKFNEIFMELIQSNDIGFN